VADLQIGSWVDPPRETHIRLQYQDLKFRTKIRFVRFWPLLFSVVAVWGIVRLLPTIYEDIQFSRIGTHSTGWYSDLDPGYDIKGRPYFEYAYTVKQVTYGGRGLYDDETSEIYYRHSGDPIEVTFLSKRPWISTIKAVEWDLRESALWATICLIIFLWGIWLSLVSRTKTRQIIGRNSPRKAEA
jgi:hypothetical protein